MHDSDEHRAPPVGEEHFPSPTICPSDRERLALGIEVNLCGGDAGLVADHIAIWQAVGAIVFLVADVVHDFGDAKVAKRIAQGEV